MKTGLKQKYATKEERENCKDLLRDSKVDEYTKEIRRLHDRYPNDKIILFDLAAHYLREDINPSEGMLYFAMAIDKKNMYSIYYEKGMYYLNHGEFGKARIEFEKLLSGNTIMQCRGIVNIIRCDIHLNYYSEALLLFRRLSQLSEKCNFEIPYATNLLFYLKYNNGELSSADIAKYRQNNYYAQMVINYDPQAVINHVIEHNTDEFLKEHPENTSRFDDNVDIEEIYWHCTDAINGIFIDGDIEPNNYSITGDYYIVPVGTNIGISVAGLPSESVELFTLPGTKDIITMHPTSNRFSNRRFEDNLVGFKAKKLAAKEAKKKENDIEPYEY